MQNTASQHGIVDRGPTAGRPDAPGAEATPTFRRVAGVCALLAAIIGVLYTVTFAIYVKRGYHWAHWASAVAAMIGGLVVVPVLVALHAKLRRNEPQIAAIAFVVGIVGALGATIHGGFDVAVLSHPLASIDANAPSQIDPRGLLTFAFVGAALGLFGLLALRDGELPRHCGRTGVAAAVILFVVYFGRLIALDPNANAIRVSALIAGLVVVPAFYLQLAHVLLRSSDEVTA